MEATVDDTSTSSDPNQVIYRCEKCRRIVASEEYIVSHEIRVGQTRFKWKKKSDELDMEPPECFSIFVEPLKWMQSGCVGDKLLRLGCKARLGSFNWAGMQCICGTWINPAFQLHKSRTECRIFATCNKD